MNQSSDPPIPQVVEAIAEAESAEPCTLDPPLAAVVDLDALETLIEETTASDLEVHFTYRGHSVVDRDGRVQVS